MYQVSLKEVGVRFALFILLICLLAGCSVSLGVGDQARLDRAAGEINRLNNEIGSLRSDITGIRKALEKLSAEATLLRKISAPQR